MNKTTRRKLKPGEKPGNGPLINDSVPNKETVTEDFGKLWSNNNNNDDKSMNNNERKNSNESVGSGAGLRRASLIQQVENMQKLNKTVTGLANRRKSKPSESAPKYYWDDTNPEEEEKKKREMTRKKAMSKEAAMSVLGLGRGTKNRNLTDYSEKELFDAFSEESKVLLENPDQQKKKSQQDMHEAYQILLKIVKAKNRFKSKRAAKLQQDQAKTKEREEEEAKKKAEEERIAEEEREEAAAQQKLIDEKKDEYFSDTESELSESDLWNSTKAVTFQD